jgi:branched-chain amino acid transport system permease protein
MGSCGHGTRMRRYLVLLLQLAAPAVLVVAVGVGSTLVSSSNEIYFLNALCSVAIVVAIYVFIGNSGVLSFGQISFVAVGAFVAGVMTIPLESKTGVLPQLFPVLRDHTVGNVTSLLLGAAAGGVFALIVGLPLMRLSGLAAGIATFAVLEVTHNILREWTKIGPGATTLSLVPETTDALQATIGVLAVIAAAFAYQLSRFGRRLRASREDTAAARGVGVSVHRERLWAFTVSGALAGFAGALLVHLLGSITTEQVYLELTFLTLAMLVVGGLTSLWGAVVGALVVSALDSFLIEAEQGVKLGVSLDLPQGTRLIFLGAIMALVLIVRPSGLTGGREFRLVR